MGAVDRRVVGADADALWATGRAFVESAEQLRRHRHVIASTLAGSAWTGADARRHRHAWDTSLAPHLAAAAAYLDQLGRRLGGHASEQRAASAARSSVRSGSAPTVVSLLGPWIDPRPDSSPTVVEVEGRGRAVFAASPDGRSAIAAAMEGLADERRIARDEIEIRALDNGRYIVVLPGVTDLSEGAGEFVDRLRTAPFDVVGAGRDAFTSWADNDEPTVRKMRYAFEAAVRDDVTVNEYSSVAVEALERAGVPAGAEVMLIGHSFGAYTAMDLAADRALNSAHGDAPPGYHLEITHVIAAGAETDWRLDELPTATDVLVLNNRFDAVVRAEDLLHRDQEPVHPGQVEHDFWGGWSNAGHDEAHYLERVREPDAELATWLDAAGERYGSGGVRVSATVPDPNL